MHLRSAFRVVTLCLLPSMVWASGDGGDTPLRDLGFQALNFILLIGLIVYLARKPASEFFAGRHKEIKVELDESAELLAQAEARHGEIQQRLDALQTQLEEMEQASRKRTEEEGLRILSDARRSADRIQSDAGAAIDQELLRARRELRAEAAELAVELAREILNEQVGDGDRDRLLDEFIASVDAGAGRGSPTA